MRNERMVSESVKKIGKYDLRPYLKSIEPVIRMFKDGKILVSKPFMSHGSQWIWVAHLRPLNEAEEKLVSEFENEHEVVVYHVVKNRNEAEVGRCYALLYVSKDEVDRHKIVLDSCFIHSKPSANAFVINVGHVTGDETEFKGTGEFSVIEFENHEGGLVWDA